MESEWEKRSKVFGNSIRGVLFKGLPDSVNQYFHNWHEKTILNLIKGKGSSQSISYSLKDMPSKLRILDVGCGYGRLSIPIIKMLQNVDIMGLDISQNYVRLYEENTGYPATIGEIEDLNGFGNFDYIVCATVLMYSKDPEVAMKSMISHLGSTGKLILIEPHTCAKWFQGHPLIIRSSNTGGRPFTVREIKSLVDGAGGRVVKKKFNLPPIFVAYLIERDDTWKSQQAY